MTNHRRAILIERLAEVIYIAEGGSSWDRVGEGKKDDYRYIAKTAIYEITETCARVAEKHGSDVIAAEIRELKSST